MLFNITVTKLNVVELFDTTKLPESSVQYVTEYGFRKCINDAHASVKRESYPAGDSGTTAWLADVRKLAYARIDQIRSGQVPRGGQTVDAARVEANKHGIDLDALVRAEVAKRAATKKVA